MRRRGLNLRKALLRAILPLVRRLPPRAASRLLSGIGQLEYRLGKRLKLRFDAAVGRYSTFFGVPWDPQRVGRALAGNQIRWRTRDQLLDGLPREAVDSVISVEGRQHLDVAVSYGKGVILLGNHFGAHLIPAHWLLRESYPLRLFMERPHHISKFLDREFRSDGPLGQSKLFISRRSTPLESAGSILRVGRVLKAGMVVMIAGDVRWEGSGTAEAEFLGETYRFSATWVTLAAMTGVPVVPVFCRMEPDGSHLMEFLPGFFVPNDGAKPEKMGKFVQSCLRGIEERVRLHPENSNEYFFWNEPAIV